jgi:hypothetical protein
MFAPFLYQIHFYFTVNAVIENINKIASLQLERYAKYYVLISAIVSYQIYGIRGAHTNHHGYHCSYIDTTVPQLSWENLNSK